MRVPSLILAIAACSSLLYKVQCKAVFAHYMVGTVTEDHANIDIDAAKAMGLDGFALNVGDPTQSFVSDTLALLFSRAESVGGFHLYISMDIYASGAACYAGSTSCNGPFDYAWIFDKYLHSSAYYIGPNGYPMVSTFSSGGFHNTNFTDWKDTLSTPIYFIPDFDETTGYYNGSASYDGWYYYWGDVLDGVFSWEAAWPVRGNPSPGTVGGSYPGDIGPDLKVIPGAVAHNKGYMMGLSTIQYKNSYGANVYRGGGANLPQRMANILGMETQPDFIQVQTWNDGPESHNIATLWPEQNNDTQPSYYMGSDLISPHVAWQPLITSFIAAWKAGGSASSMAPPSDSSIGIGAMWYKKTLQDTVCPNDDGNIDTNGTELFWEKPDGFDSGSDDLNWAFVLASGLPSGYSVKLYSGGDLLTTVALNAGLNFGSTKGLQACAAYIELLDSVGTVMMTASGGFCVSSDCPDGIYNMNYQVKPFVMGSATIACTVDTSDEDILTSGPDWWNDPYPPYPSLTNPDGTNISVKSLRGTRLYGWKGCSVPDSQVIAEAYDDFYKLSQQPEVYNNIEWTSQAAKELFGPAAGVNRVSDARRKEIQQIFAAAQQVYNYGWWTGYPPWLPNLKSLWIEVRCSSDADPSADPDNYCRDRTNDGTCPGDPGYTPPDENDPSVQAWSNPSGTYSQITFCNAFFNKLSSLSEVVSAGQKEPAAIQNNLETWDSRARCFFHEVTHLTYFMNTPGQGPNVEDLQIKFKKAGRTITDIAYGPYNAKILRNYVARGKGGFYTQRNADNYAFFATAKYVEGKIGRYPNLPNPGSKKPTEAPRDPFGEPIEITADDTVLDPETDLSIGVNPDDDLLGTVEMESSNQTIAGFSQPHCPDLHPSSTVSERSMLEFWMGF